MRRPRIEIPEWLDRLPALSLALVVVWLLVGLVVEIGFASRLRNAERELREAVSFAIHNPVVEVDARLLPVVRAMVPGFEGNEMFSFLRRKRAPEDAPSPQQRSDALTRQAFETLDSHPYRLLGFVPAALSAHALVTHLFVHAGWLHLLGTVLLWLLTAPLLEELWGRRVFAAASLLLGLVGAAIFAVVRAGADHALLGGSAVLGGLVAAVVVRFREQELDFLGWLAPFADAELRAPAWALAGLWAVYEALLWWSVPGVLPRGVDNAVGYAAHAAGALVGGLLPLAIARLGWEQRYGRWQEAVVRKAKHEGFDFQKVLQARARGEEDRAFELLRAEVRRSARNRDAVCAFWEMAVGRGAPEQAAPAMLQLVREELRRGAEGVAVAQWRELAEHLPSVFLDSSTLLRLVPFIRRAHGDEHVLVALQQAVDERNRGLTPTLAAQVARLAAELDPELALGVARRALAAEALDGGLRAELEALVAGLATRREEAAQEEGEERQKEVEGEKTPPPSVFYLESDRSAFGEVGDLSALDDTFPDGAVTDAIPLVVDAEAAVRIEIAGKGQSEVAYSRIRAVAVAGVHGLRSKPVVLVDLLVDGAGTEGPLRVIRLRSDRFDPRRLAPGAGGPLDALRQMVQAIVSRSGAQLLPDPQGAAARPVRVFEDLGAYHEQVLRPAARDLV